jgi:hypothetical protein
MIEFNNIDQKEYTQQRVFMEMRHRFHDFIAEANREEFENRLWEFLTDTEVVIISKAKFDQYVAIEKTMLDQSSFKVDK